MLKPFHVVGGSMQHRTRFWAVVRETGSVKYISLVFIRGSVVGGKLHRKDL